MAFIILLVLRLTRHNSMASTTIPHWLFAQQDGSIADQLNDGIHGLLIDTYYGFQEGARVRTDLSRVSKIRAVEQEIGAPAVEAALRIRGRMGPPPTGKPGIFLCHGFCELGAITLSSALDDIRSFLVTHPGDVVVIINQDEGATPTDIERAFEQAGLLDLVYPGPLGPFPTLRTMVDSNQRLVVMAENDAGNVPPALLDRARTCERIRDRLPSLVAVDFYREGDLLGVVNALNGIGR